MAQIQIFYLGFKLTHSIRKTSTFEWFFAFPAR